jgi:hypothetical protein
MSVLNDGTGVTEWPGVIDWPGVAMAGLAEMPVFDGGTGATECPGVAEWPDVAECPGAVLYLDVGVFSSDEDTEEDLPNLDDIL